MPSTAQTATQSGTDLNEADLRQTCARPGPEPGQNWIRTGSDSAVLPREKPQCVIFKLRRLATTFSTRLPLVLFTFISECSVDQRLETRAIAVIVS